MDDSQFRYGCHDIQLSLVRMAERSKAPDSRLNTFPAYCGSWRSGLRMEAWVRIPLLTKCFLLLSDYLSCKNERGSWKSTHVIEVINSQQ